jgi:tetratricopeptide (TPR) repeat protein
MLLDWVREDWHLIGGDDPLSGSPFTRLWTKGKQGDDTAIKLAAAALLAESKDTAARSTAILESARNSSRDETEKLNIALALFVGYYNLEDYGRALTICVDLAKQYPESERIFQDRSFELRVLGRLEEAQRLEEDRLQRIPGDLLAMRELVWSAITREEYAAAHALGEKILEAGKAAPQDLNSIAWSALFTGKVETSDVEDALKATQLSQNNPAELHTLGCVYAEIGKTKEAREVLLQAMDRLNLDDPDDNYWYAFGRIAEQYGEYETAKYDYLRVAKPKRPIDMHDSSYRLAQIRLKAMGILAQK